MTKGPVLGALLHALTPVWVVLGIATKTGVWNWHLFAVTACAAIILYPLFFLIQRSSLQRDQWKREAQAAKERVLSKQVADR